MCAGHSSGATYCFSYYTSLLSVAGSWRTFNGKGPSSSTYSVYGCGVLSSGAMRCVSPTGVAYDYPGQWRDVVHIRGGVNVSTDPFTMVAVSDDGEIFDPQR